MERVRYLIVGAGMSGLAFANFVRSRDLLILERDPEIGGYCKTVHQDGFVWDYSGHFFHFRHPEIERYLTDRMPPGEVSTVVKEARILYGDRLIDFPFQKNIHQLPQAEFIDCLVDLFQRSGDEKFNNFEEMLVAKFGRGIAERFLIPYNEKLYACALGALDVDAMGRFFPFADLEEIIANFRRPDNGSYNATFTYPRGGAIEYVKALASEVPADRICLGEGLAAVDLERKVARTSLGREIGFEYLISSAPLPALLEMTGLPWAREDFSANQVAVFNLGFDRKGWEGVHWVYFPSPSQVFYRVGFYDNILGGPRMSLYVEVGQREGERVDMDALRERVLDDLRGCGVIAGHHLVSHHQIILNPAYVHITRRSLASVARLRGLLQARGVYPVGRYGGWTYCSIEDNIVEARALAGTFNALHHRDQGE